MIMIYILPRSTATPARPSLDSCQAIMSGLRRMRLRAKQMERGENRIRIEFALERRSRFAHDTDVLPLSICIRWLYSVVPRGRLHCLPLSIGRFHSGRSVGPTDRWTEGRGQVTLDGRRCANRRSLARLLIPIRDRVSKIYCRGSVGRSVGRG